MDYERLQECVQARGLMVRGGFHPDASDGVPPLPDGRPAKTLVMLGGVGTSFWQAFQASPEAAQQNDPLDAWTRRVTDELASDLGAVALFPFGGPPYLPFQRWAKRAEPAFQSPLGLLIHPDYGLWHSYRAALAFAEVIPLPARAVVANPCDSCAEMPCLTSCPVGAFSQSGYDVPKCIAHLHKAEGAACLETACLARRACPVGRAYAYPPEQARFHMSAFLRAHSGSQGDQPTNR
jgi:ferredoxin